MTAEDDAYVAERYAPLDRLADDAASDVDELAQLVLAGKLPLPSYLASDGTPMFAPDLLSLAVQAGGVDRLPAWFGEQYTDPAAAVSGWHDYLSGQLVCLKSVTPATMQRKDELVELLSELLERPEGTDEWLDLLHRYADELDALEPPFAAYDRLRFGGPVSRDRLIHELRSRYPRRATPAGHAA